MSVKRPSHSVAVCLILLGGCSLTGTWKAVSVSKTDGEFPWTHLSFDQQRQFTATASIAEETRTSTGRYSWNGFHLILTSGDGTKCAFRARRLWNGNLKLVQHGDDARKTAIFERINP